MNTALHYQDDKISQKWRENILSLHEGVAPDLRGVWNKTASASLGKYLEHQKGRAFADANTRLRVMASKLTINGWRLDSDDYALRERADFLARCGADIFAARKENCGFKLRDLCIRNGVEFPEPSQRSLDLDGIEPAYKRVCCERWWRRQLRKMQGRKVEEIARDMRIVSQKKQIYCSNFNVDRRKAQKARNKKLLDQLKATNDDGQSFTLSELADKTTSKPANRRAELMVRIRGFQEYAESEGHDLLFVTVTCPSEYHPYSGAKENAKFNEHSVRDSASHLSDTWALCRSWLARRDAKSYGFRVAEPHHDGTVHYHYLLFCDSDSRSVIQAGFKAYFLDRYSPAERGAQKYRVNFKENLPVSAAAGYIAKYISKNIDGHGIDSDLYNHDAKSSARRIDAWASTHGIRQFQQIGGASVTVWREMRRLSNDHENSGLLWDIQAAADASNWAAYTKLMGGGFVKRIDQPVRLAKKHECDLDTGEILDAVKTAYGDTNEGRVFGVMFRGREWITRHYRWVVEWVNEASKDIGYMVDDFMDDAEMEYFLSGEPPDNLLAVA